MGSIATAAEGSSLIGEERGTSPVIRVALCRPLAARGWRPSPLTTAPLTFRGCPSGQTSP